MWENFDTSSDVDTIPIYKKPESRVTQIDRHVRIKNADELASKRDWKEDLKTDK